MHRNPRSLPEPTAGGGHCRIVPPFLLATLAVCDDPEMSRRAVRTLEHDTAIRGYRSAAPARGRASEPAPDDEAPDHQGPDSSAPDAPAPDAPAPGAPPDAPAPDAPPAPRRTVSDAANGETLPGEPTREEGDPAVADVAVNEAYDGLGDTWALYWDAYRRNSLDGNGLPLLATVHFGRDYDNAYWDGTQIVFGDGDGRVFGRFTASVEVIGHELTHGVIEFAAGLQYQGQPGALNESIADVFGSLVKQHQLGQTAESADWLIGADLLMPGIDGVALRSMKAPGTAYDDPVLGKDPQPADMSGYVETTSDNGGVHINSGILNRAFYLVAAAIGGEAWEAPGHIWYAAVTGSAISPDCDFATFAGLTASTAGELYGIGSTQHQAVLDAWNQVGLPITAPPGDQPDTGGGPDSTGTCQDDTADRLTIRRSGGITGITVERSIRISELPADDAEHWTALLADRRLDELADRPPAPDRFVYQLWLPPAGSRRSTFAVGEQDLPDDVRELVRRTLRTM